MRSTVRMATQDSTTLDPQVSQITLYTTELYVVLMVYQPVYRHWCTRACQGSASPGVLAPPNRARAFAGDDRGESGNDRGVVFASNLMSGLEPGETVEHDAHLSHRDALFPVAPI